MEIDAELQARTSGYLSERSYFESVKNLESLSHLLTVATPTECL